MAETTVKADHDDEEEDDGDEAARRFPQNLHHHCHLHPDDTPHHIHTQREILKKMEREKAREEEEGEKT